MAHSQLLPECSATTDGGRRGSWAEMEWKIVLKVPRGAGQPCSWHPAVPRFFITGRLHHPQIQHMQLLYALGGAKQAQCHGNMQLYNGVRQSSGGRTSQEAPVLGN